MCIFLFEISQLNIKAIFIPSSYCLCRLLLIMTAATTFWPLSNLFPTENDFFRPQEKQQLQNAYEHFVLNTKCKTSNYNEHLFEEDNAQMLLQSKIQLFQLFIRTQPVNIRNFR